MSSKLIRPHALPLALARARRVSVAAGDRRRHHYSMKWSRSALLDNPNEGGGFDASACAPTRPPQARDHCCASPATSRAMSSSRRIPRRRLPSGTARFDRPEARDHRHLLPFHAALRRRRCSRPGDAYDDAAGRCQGLDQAGARRQGDADRRRLCRLCGDLVPDDHTLHRGRQRRQRPGRLHDRSDRSGQRAGRSRQSAAASRSIRCPAPRPRSA